MNVFIISVIVALILFVIFQITNRRNKKKEIQNFKPQFDKEKLVNYYLSNDNIHFSDNAEYYANNSFSIVVREKTTDELVNIFNQAYNWNKDFINVVEAELSQRGIDLQKYRLERAKIYSEKEAEFQNGKQGNSLYIVLGVILSLTANLSGIIIGYIYNFGTRTSEISEKKI